MNDNYRNLFEYIKSHDYVKFTNLINSIREDDPEFDVNIKDEQNNYLLVYAVNLNLINIIKLLIECGAKIDITDGNGKSILFIPITYMYYDTLKILLDANKESIGISIIDIKDTHKKIPLHYAIELRNIKAINMLIDAGSSVNITDSNNNNSLHLAVKSRSLEICSIIVKKIADINSKYSSGETALHIACNLQLVSIAKLLIANNINTNIQDFSHEVTALHYSILIGNKELVNLLLQSGADPNIQDIYGNTILHYAIYENNFEVLNMLIKSEKTKNIINLNLWNIDGEIPLHIVFKSDLSDLNAYIDLLIDGSNMSLSDNTRNTCLHYLIKNNLWKDYHHILIKKRLDIFAKNIDNITPINMIDKKDYDKFIDMVTESYTDRLKKVYDWNYEWQNICSREFDEKSVSNLDKFIKNGEKITANNFNKSCSNIIRNHIIELINKVNRGEETKCYERSFPTKIKMCININEGNNLDFCSFIGSTLDVLIGLIYILKKHSNCCSTLTKNFFENKKLCSYYKSIGIVTNNKCEFLNFEIVWTNNKLHLTDDFESNFKKCLQKKRFIIIPLGIEMKEGNHANYLIYDDASKEVERFEPHGNTTPIGLHYNPKLLDDILEKNFKDISSDITYIRPSDFMPKVAFQLMDAGEKNKKKIGDPIGWCALWVIWYVDQRLTYSNISRKELVVLLIKLIKEKNISFKNLIRNYGENIINIRDDILKKSKMNINDWMNDQYTDEMIKTFMQSLNSEISKIIR